MVKATLRSTAPGAAVAPIVDVEATATPVPQERGSTSKGLEEILPVGDSAAAPVSQAVAPRTAAPVSVPRDASFSGEGFDGDWGQEDLKFPQLKLVQGSGPLSTQFDEGTLIYADLELLPPPSKKAGVANPVLRFVPISITKQFREKLSQDQVDAGEMPRIANSVAEVEELGGTTRWVGNQMPDNFWEPSARMTLLIELPEGSEHPSFSLEIDGKHYAVAVYYAAGGAFRESAKIIFNTAQTSLLVPVPDGNGGYQKTPAGQIIKKLMLYKNFWTICWAKKQVGNFAPWRPIVKLLSKEETSPSVREYCANLLHGNASAADE